MAASLASRLATVQARIVAAAQLAGRDPSSVRLLAVSKTQTPGLIQAAYDAGLRSFGENYVQEALSKQPLLPADIEWHCIGPLQSNKSGPVAEHFAWCHSLDSLKLAQRLGRQRPATLAPLNVCLQLNVGNEASKSGLAANELLSLADTVERLPGLRLRGLMTIPPASSEPSVQRRWFAEAAAVYEQLRSYHPDVETLSMGMSTDLEAAIAEGSTLIRIGSALFGERVKKPHANAAPV